MNNFYKVITVIITIFASTSALAANTDTNQGSSPNGKPFLSLQAQIDQTKADLDLLAADNASALADLELDIAGLQLNISQLQTQIDSNDADIALLEADTADNSDAIAALNTKAVELEDELDALTGELATKQDVLNGTGACGSDSSLRVIYPDGGYACEYDNTRTNVSVLARYSSWVWVASYNYQYFARAACPSGYFTSGGGSEAYYNNYKRVFALLKSAPAGNGWQVSATRTYPSNGNYIRAVAMCIRSYH